MNIYKISNFVGQDGRCDYKGLDINKFVAGSQVYPNALDYCVIMTDEVISNTDVVEITEAEYDSIKNSIVAPKSETQVNTERIDAMESAVFGLMFPM